MAPNQPRQAPPKSARNQQKQAVQILRRPNEKVPLAKPGLRAPQKKPANMALVEVELSKKRWYVDPSQIGNDKSVFFPRAPSVNESFRRSGTIILGHAEPCPIESGADHECRRNSENSRLELNSPVAADPGRFLLKEDEFPLPLATLRQRMADHLRKLDQTRS